MSKLGQQIRELREKRGLSQRELGLATGIEQATISLIERGQQSLISPHLEKLAEYLGVEILNPLGGNVEPFVLEGLLVPNWPQSLAAEISRLPAREREKQTGRRVMTAKKHSRDTFAVTVETDSMLPRFHRGDVVIADPKVIPEAGRYVIAARAGFPAAVIGQYAERGLAQDGTPRFELVPTSQLHPSFNSEADALTVLGVIVEQIQYL